MQSDSKSGISKPFNTDLNELLSKWCWKQRTRVVVRTNKTTPLKTDSEHRRETEKSLISQTRDSSDRRTLTLNEHCHEKKYSSCVLTKDRSAQI